MMVTMEPDAIDDAELQGCSLFDGQQLQVDDGSFQLH